MTLSVSGGTVAFKYDPFGRRIYKSSSAGTSIYTYDNVNLIEETNTSGAVVARYSQTQNIDEPLAESRSGATSYYDADGLGSVTSLTNGAGALANTYAYDSFGKLTASTGSITNPFRYTGREFDSETSLYFYRARYYDSSGGRFLKEDPITFSGGVDFYPYTHNNPVNDFDPFGMQEPVPVPGPTPTPAPTPNPVPQPPGLWPGFPFIPQPKDEMPPVNPGDIPNYWNPGSPLSPRPPVPPVGWDLPTGPPLECENGSEPDCKKATRFHLDGAGIPDPHAFKGNFLGNKAPISRYDICACKDGSIIIKAQGKCGSPGPGIPTGYRWK